jgi:hypothetical protein
MHGKDSVLLGLNKDITKFGVADIAPSRSISINNENSIKTVSFTAQLIGDLFDEANGISKEQAQSDRQIQSEVDDIISQFTEETGTIDLSISADEKEILNSDDFSSLLPAEYVEEDDDVFNDYEAGEELDLDKPAEPEVKAPVPKAETKPLSPSGKNKDELLSSLSGVSGDAIVKALIGISEKLEHQNAMIEAQNKVLEALADIQEDIAMGNTEVAVKKIKAVKDNLLE